MTITIEIKNLTRLFDDFVAVDKLNLSINSGEIFVLLGPNAAGKSTTIRLLAGILRPDSGEANILGFNLFTQAELIKQRIGYVAQQFSLYPDLTVLENITFYAGLYGVDNINYLQELLDLYDLAQFKNKPAGLLSGGYKRRLAIACATTHDPELVFLDESTAGIDPVTRKELWDLFYSLSNSRKEFIQLRRDPRLVGFIIVMPIILTTLFGFALKLEPDNVKMAYVDKDPSVFSNLIKTNIWNEGYFNMYEVADVADIENEIRLGRARAGLYIPENFSAELIENNQPSVTLFIDGTMPSLATAMDNNSSAITDEALPQTCIFQIRMIRQ